MIRKLSILLSLLVLSQLGAASAGDSWPGLRGPASDGRIEAPGTFDADGVGLDLAWRIPVGSAYSGIAVAEGKAITMFADGEGDWVAAFDVKTGERVWRHRLGDVSKGHDGSDDGPVSSPAIGGDWVHVLTPAGGLTTLRLGDGEVLWKKQIDQAFGAEPPHFGFGTSPLVDGDVLVLQAGGEDGKAIVALSTRTGETLWYHGDDSVNYQSPAMMTLAGRSQIVAASRKKITGLAVADGDVLWVHELGEDDQTRSTTPTFVGDDRFLVSIGGDAVVYRVSKSKKGFDVEELYRSKALGQSYAPPVYHDGHVYGFRGQILTCMDAATGQRVWRSRPPGGDGLILVDGHLVIWGSKGNVVVVAASPEGYTERARLQALDGSSLTWPAFADGRIYVRNLSEMAAVGVTAGEPTMRAAAVAKADHAFGRWVAEVEASDDRASMVDAFLGSQASIPMVEGEYVHFVFRAPDAEDVGIAGTMLDNETAEAMTRIEGTDLFYRTYRVEPGARWEYQFQVDFEAWKTDPANPRTVPPFEGEDRHSELVTPGYAVSEHVAEPEGERGRVEEFTLPSDALGYEKKIKVWLPDGYDESEATYPLLIVNDGDAWLDKGLMVNTLDNVVGKTVAPVVVAFVEPYRQWWLEAGGGATDQYVRMQVEELIPELEKRYRLSDGSEARAVMGNLFYGFSAAYAAIRHPEVFGKIGLQSVYTGMGHGDELVGLVQEGSGAKSLTIYLDWNRYDVRNIDRDWNMAEDSRILAEQLEQSGYRVKGGEVLDSGGWGGWRNRTDKLLAALYPAE
jgi:enterochelin esterase-like enzyme/outer membrane protein assembly factor BamB